MKKFKSIKPLEKILSNLGIEKEDGYYTIVYPGGTKVDISELVEYIDSKIKKVEKEFRSTREEEIKLASKLATKLERDSWLNQKANDHDTRIRDDERSRVLLELLQVFNDYETPITMTAENARKIIAENLSN